MSSTFIDISWICISVVFRAYQGEGAAVELFLWLRHNFHWEFIVANTRNAILGTDFLQQFNLLVDLKNKQLLDEVTQLKATGHVTAVYHSTISTFDRHNKYIAI